MTEQEQKAAVIQAQQQAAAEQVAQATTINPDDIVSGTE